MNDEEFEKKYPRELYTYKHKDFRAKGGMGQTEIDRYEIISKETGEIVCTATRTEHTNHKLQTTVNWN